MVIVCVDALKNFSYMIILDIAADMNDFKDVPNDAVIQMYMNIFEETFRITGNWGQYQRLMNI